MLTAKTEIDLASLFRPESPWILERTIGVQGARREERRSANGDQFLLDRFPSSDAVCAFLRLNEDCRSKIRFGVEGGYHLKSSRAGGWLLEPEGPDFYYWIPQPAMLRQVTPYGHILKEQATDASQLQMTANSAALEFQIPAHFCFDVVMWQIPFADKSLIGEFDRFAPLETQAIYLWGSHTTYCRPSDVYQHLIGGHVYEKQFAWPYNRRICSENDAHALYVAMNGLERATGKLLYALLKRQLLLAVLSRQNRDGGWRHGEWSDGMEAHFRLNCSAIHLMLEAIEERDDGELRDALQRAVEFVSSKTGETEFGKWFLHDELELSEADMVKSPFRWQRSNVLGKSVSNMLVLNTHLDALIALERYQKVTGSNRFTELIDSGRKAAGGMLRLRAAEPLYRAIFWAIGLTLLPTEKAKQLPLHLRAVKRIAWKYLTPNLYRLKCRYPRLVMPGGYVDRALSLRSWSFHYLTVNAMDLIRFHRMFPGDGVDDIAMAAMEFTHRSGILEKWAELDYEKYALGYWCEALYRLIMISPNAQYRSWLAESVQILEKQHQGLPPSVLGGNGEVVSRSCQVPTPLIEDERIRVVNLSRAGISEFMLINASTDEIAWEGHGNLNNGDRTWVDAQGNSLGKEALRLPPGTWLSGAKELVAS